MAGEKRLLTAGGWPGEKPRVEDGVIGLLYDGEPDDLAESLRGIIAQFEPQYVTFAGLTPLQAARTHLALPEFAAAWEQGNAMPLAEAVALALAETG